MTTHHAKTTTQPQLNNTKQHQKHSFSAATIAVAKMELKRAETQSDEDFLIRAEMDKILGSF